jgi:uncharacterized membrane-anchored protein
MRSLPAIIFIALVIAGAVFIADRPGAVSLVWQGWRVDTSVAVLVLGVALIAMLAAALFHFLRLLIRGPHMIRRGRRERRRRRGYRRRKRRSSLATRPRRRNILPRCSTGPRPNSSGCAASSCRR